MTKQKHIDLHMHSTVSDGTNTPSEILSLVAGAGLDHFSLTDHDAIRGCAEICEQLDALSTEERERQPRFISGVEFSCKDEEGKYHILGYRYDLAAPSISAVVEQGHAYRMKKVQARLDFLKESFGFSFSEEDLAALFALDNPGKPHIGNLMVKYGYADSKDQAIHEYMNRDTDFKFEVLSSIKAINNLIRRMENAQKIQRFRMDGQFIWLLPIIISEFEKRTKHEELSDESIANIIKMYEKKVSLFNEYLSKREKSYFSAIEKESAEFLTSN